MIISSSVYIAARQHFILFHGRVIFHKYCCCYDIGVHVSFWIIVLNRVLHIHESRIKNRLKHRFHLTYSHFTHTHEISSVSPWLLRLDNILENPSTPWTFLSSFLDSLCGECDFPGTLCRTHRHDYGFQPSPGTRDWNPAPGRLPDLLVQPSLACQCLLGARNPLSLRHWEPRHVGEWNLIQVYIPRNRKP